MRSEPTAPPDDASRTKPSTVMVVCGLAVFIAAVVLVRCERRSPEPTHILMDWQMVRQWAETDANRMPATYHNILLTNARTIARNRGGKAGEDSARKSIHAHGGHLAIMPGDMGTQGGEAGEHAMKNAEVQLEVANACSLCIHTWVKTATRNAIQRAQYENAPDIAEEEATINQSITLEVTAPLVKKTLQEVMPDARNAGRDAAIRLAQANLKLINRNHTPPTPLPDSWRRRALIESPTPPPYHTTPSPSPHPSPIRPPDSGGRDFGL